MHIYIIWPLYMVRQRKIVDATALCPGTAGICIFDRSKAPPISVDLRWSPLFISKSSFEHPHFFHFIQNLQNLSQDFPGLPIFSPSPVPFFFVWRPLSRPSGPGPGAETERRLGGGAADGEDAAGGGAEGPRFLGVFRMEKNGDFTSWFIYVED